ncbi:hypothetical protein Ahy_B09g095425 isoform B [Arachis hypogaea]|uniref:FAR1 domain-containing protein n=1 Tax=Arachis hypogaea TaxID=3818 RepID=A0A444XE68_ARAHY|nr:hypothetical protein Ahy_B09g095425 isoform B [Arachis hypogaea]
MEFDSEADAKNFYDEYARQEGFIVRIDKCHRSEIDNRIISRRLTCNKEGFHVRESKDKRIRQLTKELERRDQQCQQYRKLILSLLETVEEQNKFLSTKVEHVVQCVKQLENDVQKPLDTS